MTIIRVLLADDHTVLRDSLRAFLDMFADIEIVGEAGDGIETLESVENLHPDVLLLDMNMPRLSGLDVLRRVSKKLPECRVLILTQHESPQYVLPALELGAKGFLLKRASGQEVVQAIRALAAGDSYLDPSVASFVIEAATKKTTHDTVTEDSTNLTLRQKEVLSLIAEGLTNLEIAQALGISPKTVDKHRANLMDKLGIHTRAGLIHFALNNPPR